MSASDSDASYTLQSDQLSWLDLMLLGAIPSRYELPLPRPGLRPKQARIEVPAVVADAAEQAGELALLDPEGVTLARLTIDGRAGGDPASLAGPVTPVSGISHLDQLDLRKPPSAVAPEWPDGPVVALWSEAPVPLSVRRAAAERARKVGGQLLQVVPVPSGQETSLHAHLGPRLARRATTRGEGDRAVVIPAPTLGWSAQELLLRATILRAYGATEIAVVDGDLASLGTEQPAVLAAVAELGITVYALILPVGQTHLSDHELHELLDAGRPLPQWFAEPTVAAEISRIIRPPVRAGFTVLLSGLSGSGKSTVARALAIRLLDTEQRSVSLLDGDAVRHHLSKGLGFGRADRDTNVRRIGFVASEITKAGGIAICCPIAPYDTTRRDVRAMVDEQGGFFLVHVATPLAECERRDRKGLYAKARHGEIREFTGISDPYDVPTDAELVIDTTGRSIESCVDAVLGALRVAGFVPGPAPDAAPAAPDAART